MDIYFVDNGRLDEIETFYEACQRHRDYYRGYQKSYHPLLYFKDPEYTYQCPPEMTPTYLSFPMFHVKYKQPIVLPVAGRTSGLPALPDRTLGGRYNKAACKAFIR
ncbi:jg9103 [Pararge aegeria aegeria]|uniref:Jg9103 protein n=1 Tax=Pararge aegeria aegeria TaxID=348720 RepID=A0A8S4RWM8_9NEOP|nr:jg9103 [Pararge aegeria aegeria]